MNLLQQFIFPTTQNQRTSTKIQEKKKKNNPPTVLLISEWKVGIRHSLGDRQFALEHSGIRTPEDTEYLSMLQMEERGAQPSDVPPEAEMQKDSLMWWWW